MLHQPVLLQEVLEGLRVGPGQHIIDCTFGRGGHTRALLQASAPSGTVLAIDADERAFAEGLQGLTPAERARVLAVQDNFRQLTKIATSNGWQEADAILLDLGVSSPQLDDPSYGMSFRSTGPLDMRFDKKQILTAEKIINQWSEKEIQKILKEYGDEPRAQGLATAIVEKRRTQEIKTTHDLVNIIEGVYRWRGGKIHPATKTFQALRIAVNDELGALQTVVPQAMALLKSGGRLAVIAFHSGEDRIVKDLVRQAERDGTVRRLNKHVIRATRVESQLNHRARSAKLRLIEKI